MEEALRTPPSNNLTSAVVHPGSVVALHSRGDVRSHSEVCLTQSQLIGFRDGQKRVSKHVLVPPLAAPVAAIRPDSLTTRSHCGGRGPLRAEAASL